MPEKANISFPFTRLKTSESDYVLRPMVPCKLRHGDREMKIDLMVDTGADTSVIRKEMLEHLHIDIERCSSGGTTTCADGTNSPVKFIEIEIEIASGRYVWHETIPFLFYVDPAKDPNPPLLGRHPFFGRYRIDFRMGFTSDQALGKFTIYKEDTKRNAERYRKSERTFTH